MLRVATGAFCNAAAVFGADSRSGLVMLLIQLAFVRSYDVDVNVGVSFGGASRLGVVGIRAAVFVAAFGFCNGGTAGFRWS